MLRHESVYSILSGPHLIIWFFDSNVRILTQIFSDEQFLIIFEKSGGHLVAFLTQKRQPTTLRDGFNYFLYFFFNYFNHSCAILHHDNVLWGVYYGDAYKWWPTEIHYFSDDYYCYSGRLSLTSSYFFTQIIFGLYQFVNPVNKYQKLFSLWNKRCIKEYLFHLFQFIFKLRKIFHRQFS